MGVIVVVLPKLENAKKVKKILLEHGFQTVFACSSASSALQMVGEYSYGLVISGYRMPDMYYLDLVDCLPRDFESILLGSEETVAQVGAGILSLTMPIKAYDHGQYRRYGASSAGAADQKENPDTQKTE